MRVSNKRVKFWKPFILEGLQGVQPSGTYSVETRDERTGFFSFLDAKRMSTWIRICRNPGIDGVLQIVKIDPLDLQTALVRDAMSDGAEKYSLNSLAEDADENAAGPATIEEQDKGTNDQEYHGCYDRNRSAVVSDRSGLRPDLEKLYPGRTELADHRR